MARRTTVLLGAGASVDAGLPVSTRLTEELGREIDRSPRSPVAQALHIVVGSIIAHETRLGASPYAGVDVERAFSAIKMLSERDYLEVAPFVGNWTDTLLGSREKLPAFWGKRFSEALVSHSATDVEKVFKRGVHALTSTTTDAGVYRDLMHEMLSSLVKILTVEEASRFSYLCPIFDLDGVRIATLNYDRGVELAASNVGTHVDLGIENWSGGFDWRWNGIGQPLLKLHGSIDWKVTGPKGPLDARQSGFSTPGVLVGGDQMGRNFEPGIIFGAREKLRADGPFLAMLFEFGRWLRETDDLIVAGYSFRDDHINIAIRYWLSDLSGKTVTIINPGFPEHLYYDDTKPFTQDLSRLMHPMGPPRRQSNGEQTVGPELDTEHFKLLRESAATGLAKVCTPRS